MKLTRNDIDYILYEATRRILSEISVSDAYNRFYSDIEQDVYSKVINTIQGGKTDILEPSTKWVLKLVKNKSPRVVEDLYKLRNEDGTGYLDIFERLKKRQMISGPESDLNQYRTIAGLGAFISRFDIDTVMARTKEEMSKAVHKGADDIEVPYEDERFKVVIPKTYEASCYWGQNTEWCTATRSDRRMYDHYTKQGPLYINIDKLTGKKYQFHFPSKQFMDVGDNEIVSPVLTQIGGTKGLLDFYKSILGAEDFMNMNYDSLGDGVWLDALGYRLLKADGTIIPLEEKYSEMYDFYNGIAHVEKYDEQGKRKISYINTDGKRITDQWFDLGGEFTKGWTWIGIGDGYERSLNMLNRNGEYVSDVWFERLPRYNYDEAVIEKDEILFRLLNDGTKISWDKTFTFKDFEKYKTHLYELLEQEVNKAVVPYREGESFETTKVRTEIISRLGQSLGFTKPSQAWREIQNRKGSLG